MGRGRWLAGVRRRCGSVSGAASMSKSAACAWLVLSVAALAAGSTCYETMLRDPYVKESLSACEELLWRQPVVLIVNDGLAESHSIADEALVDLLASYFDTAYCKLEHFLKRCSAVNLTELYHTATQQLCLNRSGNGYVHYMCDNWFSLETNMPEANKEQITIHFWNLSLCFNQDGGKYGSFYRCIRNQRGEINLLLNTMTHFNPFMFAQAMSCYNGSASCFSTTACKEVGQRFLNEVQTIFACDQPTHVTNGTPNALKSTASPPRFRRTIPAFLTLINAMLTSFAIY